jgi:hypothetical protein
VAAIEEIFQHVKQKMPSAFADGFSPHPPRGATTLDEQAVPDGSTVSIGRSPGFRDRGRGEDDLGEDGDISERIKENGWEAIAWYLPFHLNGTKWGVYIHWSRFKQLSSHVSKNVRVPAAVAMEAVYNELIAHELFHCRTEIFTTIAEDLTRSNLYLPYNQLYQAIRTKDECVEESLATSYGLANVKNKSVRQELERLAKSMPGAYKLWEFYPYSAAGLATNRWWEGIAKLTSQILRDEMDHIWELSAHRVPNKILAGIPRYIWVESKTRRKDLDDAVTYLLQHKDFIACLDKLFPDLNVRLVNTREGRHPHKLFIKGKRIPYKPSWDGVPPFILNQVAQALKMSGNELRKRIQECFV